jgi:hypothetical protein
MVYKHLQTHLHDDTGDDILEGFLKLCEAGCQEINISRKKILCLENKTLCPQKFEKHAR